MTFAFDIDDADDKLDEDIESDDEGLGTDIEELEEDEEAEVVGSSNIDEEESW